MSATALNKLPFGNIPRLLIAWICTEAVQTQSRELVLGRSLSEFMRKLGINSDSGGNRGELTRLRNHIYTLKLNKASLPFGATLCVNPFRGWRGGAAPFDPHPEGRERKHHGGTPSLGEGPGQR